MHSFAISTPALLQCSNGVLFGENTPKLPGPPLLAFDEVIEIDEQGGKYGHCFAIARKNLASFDWVFKSHFYADPVMPGTMMIEGMLQLAGFFGAYSGGKGDGRAAKVDDVKFLSEVTPADHEIFYRIDVKKSNRDHTILVAEGCVTARGITCTTASNLWVVIKPATRH